MMRFWRRENGIDRILERWAQPSDEFVRRVVGGIELQPRRSYRSYRLALTAGLTIVGLTLFAVFGGIGSATKAVKQAAQNVQAPTHTSRSTQPRTRVQKSSSAKTSSARANTGTKHTANAVQQGSHVVQTPTRTSHSAQPRTHLQSSSAKNSSARTNLTAKRTGSSNSSIAGTASTSGFELSRSSASAQYEGKTTICHRTGSKKNPWVLITVNNSDLPTHKAHGDTLPAGGICPGPPIP
jgi:cytoskeletal protein RodZ